MSKKFVKQRYPEAFAVKTYGWINGNPFVIYDKRGGMILKGYDVNEKKAWANLKDIIQKREEAEKGLSDIEIKELRLKRALLETRSLKIKYLKLFGEKSMNFKFYEKNEKKLEKDLVDSKIVCTFAESK